MSNSQVEKLIIIGSGPAGLTAAIYAARANLKPLVMAGKDAGGQLILTTDVDDFPGFDNGIQGPELMARMRKQAERFGTRFLNENVLSVDLKTRPFVIQSESRRLMTESLILATGASAMWLNLASEQRLRGKGVSACAVCDGFFFKNKVVAVVGGGDTALREANYLSKLCRKVFVIHRRDTFRAQAALQELVKSKTNVNFIWNSVVEEVLGEDKVVGLRIKNTQTGEISELQIDGLFVAIGHKPNTDFLKGQLELNEKGYIKIVQSLDFARDKSSKFKVQSYQTATSVEGVFAAGDVADDRYRQAITAAGAGCKASFDAEEYLTNLKY